MSDPRFKEAVTLIKAGDIEKGQKLLLRIVRDNPLNDKAWLWLVNTTPKPVNQIGCLEKVLRINPNHQTAQKLLVELRAAQTQTIDSDMGFEYMGSTPNANQTPQNGTILIAPQGDKAMDEEEDDDGFIYTGEFVSAPSFEEDDTDETAKVLQDPLMLQIEMERQKMAHAKMIETGQMGTTKEAGVERVKTAPHQNRDLTSLSPNELTRPVSEPDPPKEKQFEIQMPEKVYEFSLSMAISKAKGAFGFLFSGKNQLTKSLLKIAPDAGLLQIKGVDTLVQNEQHNLYFTDIAEIECPNPNFITFVLKNGKQIQLKEVEQLDEIIALLESKIKLINKSVLDSDVHQMTQTPDHFEASISQSA